MRDLNLNDRTNYNSDTTDSNAWLAWLGVVGGLWLVIAPFVLGYSDNGGAVASDIISGIILASLTAYCGMAADKPVSRPAVKGSAWAAALVGVWVIIAPFALGYSDISNAVWNDVITGAAFAIVAAGAAMMNFGKTTA